MTIENNILMLKVIPQSAIDVIFKNYSFESFNTYLNKKMFDERTIFIAYYEDKFIYHQTWEALLAEIGCDDPEQVDQILDTVFDRYIFIKLDEELPGWSAPVYALETFTVDEIIDDIVNTISTLNEEIEKRMLND